MRPGPGEVIRIPTTGQTKLSDSLMPWPYKEPSAASMAMGAKLEGDVRKLGGIVELPVSEGRIGNTPVGTIMSYIEAVSQVPGAVHKDDHISQQEEFELLRELIAEEPEVLTRGNKSPARQWQIAEELLSPDLIPRADPNTPSQIHRLTKAQGLVTAGGLPQFAMGDKDGPIVNQRAIWMHVSGILSGSDAAEFTHPPQAPQAAPPPPPDPRVVAAQIKAQSESNKVAGEIQKDTLDHQAKMVEIAAETENKTAELESNERRALLTAHVAQTKTAHDTAGAAADRVVDHAQHLNDLGVEKAKLSAPLVAPEGGESG